MTALAEAPDRVRRVRARCDPVRVRIALPRHCTSVFGAACACVYLWRAVRATLNFSRLATNARRRAARRAPLRALGSVIGMALETNGLAFILP